jgi:phosphatidate cytidylyltransferase
MVTMHDKALLYLFGGLLTVLCFASVLGYTLHRKVKSSDQRKVIDNLNARIRAWWAMCAVFVVAVAAGKIVTIVMFAIMSFLALREFITITPTDRADHRTIFWVFFIFTPLHYYLIYIGWYGLFAIMIPVYAFLLIPIRSVIQGVVDNFMARMAMIQWGLMLCVYCVSHVPAILMLGAGDDGNAASPVRLLFFFVLVVQAGDVLQYICGKMFGKRKITPSVSPNKTWEGFLGGVFCAAILGASLWKITPFKIWQAFLISLLIATLGFFGDICMSAIKRDRGVKDFGHLIEGHGGILDRIDSICFAAPVFFHLCRYYFF